MTEQEFQTEYKKLASVYPREFGNKFKEIAVAKAVMTLRAGWWRALVHRIILSSNTRLDIDEAARAEIAATKRYEEQQKSQAIRDELYRKSTTDEGLKNTLEKLEAKTAWEAVQKTMGEK